MKPLREWVRDLVNELVGSWQDSSGSSLTHVHMDAGSRMVIGRAPAVRVSPVARAAWDAKGWTINRTLGRTVYHGRFEVLDRRTNRVRRFAGRIAQLSIGIAAYIADPPPEIRRHPKGPCFALVEAPWFRVHWHKGPRSVDEAIRYVETVLDQALRGSGAQ